MDLIRKIEKISKRFLESFRSKPFFINEEFSLM